jgi:SAM-dependent methyltransferase
MAYLKRTDEYYDDEARVYSEKRYPERVVAYSQFLFTHRRELVLRLLRHVIANTSTPRSLFEMGCADGILLRSISARYPGAFSTMLGADISQPMIDTARALTTDDTIQYAMRDSLPDRGSYTCVMEIGVAAIILDTRNELAMFARQLAPGGYVLCILRGHDSIVFLLGRGGADRSLFKPYQEYEQTVQEFFTIVDSRTCGIYVPLIWKIPALARIVQPLAEYLGRIFPSLAHERLYLLRKK